MVRLMVESKLITSAMVRRVLAARSKGLWATWTVSLAEEGMVRLGRSFYLIPEGRQVRMMRAELGKKWRPLLPSELGRVEGMWKRGLKEAAKYMGTAPKAPPLKIDRAAATELMTLIGARPAAIERAIDSPGEYTVKRFARPVIDVLSKAGLGFELDWRSEPDELTAAATKLARTLKFPRALASAHKAPRIEVALRELARAMAKAGWALVRIDLQSDSHGSFVVPARRLPRVKARLKKLKIRVVA